jgi:prefoldin subunit 5
MNKAEELTRDFNAIEKSIKDIRVAKAKVESIIGKYKGKTVGYKKIEIEL